MSNRAQRRRQDKSAPQQTEKKSKYSGVTHFFDTYYKVLLIIPLVILLLSFGQLAYQYSTTGDILIKGISLSGGISITLEKDLPIPFSEFKAEMSSALPSQEVSVRELTNLGVPVGVIIESTAFEQEERVELRAAIEGILGPIADNEYTEEVIGPALGEQFFQQIFRALIMAFVFMGVVVFIYFRKFLPGFSVMLSTFADIVITLAIVNLLGIRLSTAGIAAFLMLIGYSVDSDLLLSTKMMKESGPYIERFMSAFKTGFTMVVTTLGAVTVAYILTDSDVIRQIMLIILIGLLVDMVTTWIQNAAMMRMYLERKDGKA